MSDNEESGVFDPLDPLLGPENKDDPDAPITMPATPTGEGRMTPVQIPSGYIQPPSDLGEIPMSPSGSTSTNPLASYKVSLFNPETLSLLQQGMQPELSEAVEDEEPNAQFEQELDDSFHQVTQTVIVPMKSSFPKPGRFSVSPAVSIPSPISRLLKFKPKSPVGSKSSQMSLAAPSDKMTSDRQSMDQEMQFMMSATSLAGGSEVQKDQGDEQTSLRDQTSSVNRTARSISQVQTVDHGEEPWIPLEQLDEILGEVDENQRTIQSGVSVNTQDSSHYHHAPLQCGNIHFVKDAVDFVTEPKKHYMCVNMSTPLEQISSFMARYWCLRNPKIVLSVISSAETFKPWKNQRLKDDFQKGIIKAANTTEMWIITSGIDAGVPKIIGDAVREHNIEQQSAHLVHNPALSQSERRCKRLVVIGVVPKETVPYGVFFDGTEGVQVKNMGLKPTTDIYELNAEHSHFIMVEEDGKEQINPVYNHATMRYAMEKQFTHKTGYRKRKRLMSLGSDTDHHQNQVQTDPNDTIPVVGLLVQGTPKNIDHVIYYLQNKMTVVVLRGSGGIADLIGYAYEEMHDKGEADPDYLENFLKPELIKMINKNFCGCFEDNEPGKLAFRDKIIQCVLLSYDSDLDHSHMTVVNIMGFGSNMRNLDKYILQGLFKSEKPDNQTLQDQLQNDLQLTIDWNRPDLAWDIFQMDLNKVRIDKKMFEQSLLQKEREQFIDLFLSQGVKVHKYLNHKKLKLLYERAEDREFFINICLEGVLGITVLPDQPLGECFLSENLNRLLYKVSGINNFIQPYELSMSSTGTLDQTTAERKALNLLIIWAVLLNRHKLAKTLWNKVDEPIGVALICSRIYRELSKYRMEQYQRTELEDNATDFGKMALGALAICWRDSSIQAYNMLGKNLPDFNNKSVIEIAHDAGYIHFLAHPCCQRWLTNTFFGNLQVKELDWGVFRLPYWFKILVSAFLIFPMYIWINFIPPRKKKEGAKDEEKELLDSEDSDSDDDIPNLSKSAFDNSINRRKIKNFGMRLNMNLKRPRDIPFHLKMYLLWTAPITKFWTTQMFYFAYLGVFSLAVLWPSCGNQYLDLGLWFWTVILEMELVCRVYNKYHKYKTLSLLGNCIDIFLILVFIVLLLLTRIMVWISITDYVQAKTIMCYGIIYFFYRLLGVYLPISPTLGPMLLRMNRMVKHDFVAFVRMFLIFMIVGGVTIQAVLYPNWPLNMAMIKRVLTRPIYAMFLTQVQDLDGDPSCTHKYKNVSNYCVNTDSHFTRPTGYEGPGSDTMISLEECPYSSLSGYIITLQYLLICKLVLVTLLFAMFALTIGKVDKEASEIWKFQRYALIADFIERFSLPPPFTVFSFIFLFFKFLVRKIWRLFRRIRNCRSCCSNKREKKMSKKSTFHRKKIDDTVFWKRVAREYIMSEEVLKEKEEVGQKHGEMLMSLQNDMRTHRKSMKRLGDRVMELERMIQSSRLVLEAIAHKLEKSDVMGITNIKGKFIHVAARQSPYPGTSLTRFPVFDKYVPWEINYDVYDPKTYTMAISKFPENERDLVDEDIAELRRLQNERIMLTDEEARLLTPVPEFKPKWNSVVSFKVNNEQCQIDRRSWITLDNQPLRYTLDPLDLPQNPLGRTGIRGRGNLWRWGPNHVIKAVVTRWRRKYGADLNTQTDFLYVEGKRVLEFLANQKDSAMDTTFCLPGDVLHGLSNPYSILVKAVMSSLSNEVDLNIYNKVDQTEMIQLFGQFASSVVGGSSTMRVPLGVPTHLIKTDTASLGFSASLLYKGYLDDPRNTDNAWVEAEVWNFHYDIGDSFDYSITEESSVKWKEVSPYVKMFGNESVIVQEAARIHDAYH